MEAGPAARDLVKLLKGVRARTLERSSVRTLQSGSAHVRHCAEGGANMQAAGAAQDILKLAECVRSQAI